MPKKEDYKSIIDFYEERYNVDIIPKKEMVEIMKKTTYSQVVKDIKSAKEFCNLNKIKPEMVIVVWNE